MFKYNRTIKALTDLNGRVYLYLPDSTIRDQFEIDAMEEGVTYKDGVPLTERKLDEIMALNEDMTVNFVGLNGRLHFKQPTIPYIKSTRLVRVDYKRYAEGFDDYIIEYRNVIQQNYLNEDSYR